MDAGADSSRSSSSNRAPDTAARAAQTATAAATAAGTKTAAEWRLRSSPQPPLLPAAFRTAAARADMTARPPVRSPRAQPLQRFLDAELSVRRLNDVHKWLWLAGLPMPPRALHVQRMRGHDIVVSESVDLHLVWQPSRIFVKPLPRYLLDAPFWQQHLCGGAVAATSDRVAADSTSQRGSALAPADGQGASAAGAAAASSRVPFLYTCALGFLLSYTALVAHESDFRIAKELGLLPEEVSWPDWVVLVDEVVRFAVDGTSQQNGLPSRQDNIASSAAAAAAAGSYATRDNLDDTHPFPPALMGRVNKRYIYGELRLSRLNLIFRVARRNWLRGYIGNAGGDRSATLGSFARRHINSLISLFAYVTVVLSAFQVGLATKYEHDNKILHRAAYEFALWSIITPVLVLCVVATLLLLLMCYHVHTSLKFHRRRFGSLQNARRAESAAMQQDAKRRSSV